MITFSHEKMRKKVIIIKGVKQTYKEDIVKGIAKFFLSIKQKRAHFHFSELSSTLFNIFDHDFVNIFLIFISVTGLELGNNEGLSELKFYKDEIIKKIFQIFH